ncbi:hypothetical protein GZH82_03525 [Staphylococcus ursi]|uniref:hypothetical protein n=1 Tax=Staphylococcus sp. MI 10-1553 TaxID=1912064 RepID=UPI00139715E4|nr:hypothetical protein [Staphylococcus sp. MI 10-1553]QHW36499.1 hypothetical protein GZH82_03525 [Staphylococcus sp. MI 10-1553]
MFIFKKSLIALALLLTLITAHIAEHHFQVSQGVNDKKSSHTRQTKRKHVIEILLKGPEYSAAVYGI